MHQEHDKGYKALLSNPEVFVGLLKSFVKEPWTERIDPKDVEQVKTSFILPTFERREKESAERTVYFYCLMELQSRVDFSIRIRLLFYMTAFWMELLKGIAPEELNRQEFRLPMIIPLVLYNGEERWTVPLDFGSVYDEDAGFFKEYLVDFKYRLIDVNRYSREELVTIGNLMSAVFLVDQKGASPETTAYMQELMEKFHSVLPILKNLNRLEASIFLQWTRGIIQERLPEEAGGLKQIMENLLRKLEQETEADMFVSNFAADWGKFIDHCDELERSARRAQEEKAQAVDWAEQVKSRVEQEKTQAVSQAVAQAVSQAEQTLRLAVGALKEAGLSTEAISQKIGRPKEEIETML